MTIEHPFDALIEKIAERVVEKLEARLRGDGARLMTAKEAAEYIRRSPGAVQQLVARGDIPAIRAGRRIHIDRGDLDEWIERNRVA